LRGLMVDYEGETKPSWFLSKAISRLRILFANFRASPFLKSTNEMAMCNKVSEQLSKWPSLLLILLV
jgi:hypothetical protein